MRKNKSGPPEAIIHRKPFHDLLNDAGWYTVHSAEEATDKKPQGNPRFTRMGILCCGLLVECAANCCIRILGMERDSEGELEFAKTFVKYDVFLLVRTGAKRHVPRSHKITRKISDLISIRNSFAHPKIAAISYAQKGHRLDPIESKTWPHIDIPRDRQRWLPLHAERAFIAASDFLNFFFFDLCGFDCRDIAHRQEVAEIFHSEIEFGDNLTEEIKAGDRRRIMPASSVAEVMALIKKFDLDCAFLGYYTHDGKGNFLLPKRELGSPIFD